jgi:hypothetical protein
MNDTQRLLYMASALWGIPVSPADYMEVADPALPEHEEKGPPADGVERDERRVS